MEILNIMFRTTLVLIILFFLAKLMGKKQISQMTLFDYIIGITIGSIAADISLDIEKELIAGITSLSIYVVFSLILSYLSMKSIFLRRYIIGVSTVLVEKGKIIESGLKKAKVNINELLEEARNNGYFDINEIDYALMEANGKISFLPKVEYQLVTKKDMNLKINKQSLTANLIIDETILDENLLDINKDRKWLLQQLKVNGYDSEKGILLATVDINEKLKIYKKDEKLQHKTILE